MRSKKNSKKHSETTASKLQMTSIYLDREMIDKLKFKGIKKGLRYQTLLKLIVNDHIHEY